MKLDKCDTKLNTYGSRVGKRGNINNGGGGVLRTYRALRKRMRRVGLFRALKDAE